jgi:hypothetical protein
LDDYERIVDRLDRTRFHDILESRYRADKSLVLPFFAVDHPLKLPPQPPASIKDGMEILANLAKEELFGSSIGAA